MAVSVRPAVESDVPAILGIYNQGIEDRVATLEENPKDMDEMRAWFGAHTGRYRVFVAVAEGGVVGWADVHAYSPRHAYHGVGELSVYIERPWRGRGVGQALLSALEAYARTADFHKLVLGTFPFNQAGQGLYGKMGYRVVGIFRNQGKLDGQWVDVMWMEKVFEPHR